MRYLFALAVCFFLLGCTGVSETQKFIADSAAKANLLGSYVVEYERNAVRYQNPNDTVYLLPFMRISKYKKGESQRWDTIDWLNTSTRFYKSKESHYKCEFNSTWECSPIEGSRMKEFLGYGVPDPAASISRQVSSGALVLGGLKGERILGRSAKCFAAEIHPGLFTERDWKEHVLGSFADRDSARGIKDLTVWQCMDEETGVKLELILNYKTEIDGEEWTVEINLKAFNFEVTELEDSLFALPA